MATQLQIRRGTAAQVAAFTGAEGEIVYNSTNDSLHTNDGATAGGFELARADLNNVSDANLNAALTGNTLSALTITTLTATGGTINGTVIGGTTAAAGSFTTVNASGTLKSTASAEHQFYVGDNSNWSYIKNAGAATGTTQLGFYVSGATPDLLISGTGAATFSGNVGIGTSSPFFTAAGRTSLSVNGTSSSILAFGKGGSSENYILADAGGFTIANTSATLPTTFFNNASNSMTIDASGNVGLGVVPSTIWSSSYDALQLGLGGSMYAHGSAASNVALSANIVYEGVAPNYYDKYLTSSTATKYAQDSGNHIWSGAASGTAGAAVSWSERMRIDASGNVGIGTSSPNGRLEAVGGTGGGFTGWFRTGDATAANNAGGGFYSTSSATAASRSALLALDADGANLSGGDYFVIQKNGNSGSTDIVQYSNAAMRFGTDYLNRSTYDMTLDASGNLGIGTSSTVGKVTAQTATVSGVSTDFDTKALTAVSNFSASDKIATMLAGYDGAIFGAAIGFSYTGAGYAMQFATNNDTTGIPIERMRIDASGNLLVGTTSFGGNVGVQARGSAGGATDEPLATSVGGTGSIVQIGFFNPNGRVGYVATSGTSTSYSTSSDYRLKEDAVPMTGATERVKALRPINFAWKADGSRTDGFLAHEAQEVVPEAVHGTKDAMRDEEYEVTPAVEEVRDEDGNVTTEAVAAVMGTRSVPDMQGIDQSKLVPLLTATIQELIARIEALEGA